MRFIRARSKRKAVEIENEARLVEAETELASLKVRAYRAMQTLDERHARNHWQEAVAKMIQGAH